MPIIIHSKDQNLDASKLNLWPDQFLTQKEKTQDDFIKSNMDYFSNVAYSQFIRNRDTFVRNYNIYKGIMEPRDYYLEDSQFDLKSFTETIAKDTDLPPHVQNYSLMGPPINTMIGELSNRPDTVRVKAYDEDSKNEELQFKTEILQQYIIQNAKQKIVTQSAMSGSPIESEEQLDQLTMERVQEYLTDYTSMAEKWGNHIAEAAKMTFNMKEISEDCFRDLLISAREAYHLYEDNSKVGMGVENINPKNLWYLTMPDKKYLKEAYAAGTVHVMELSEIMERFPDLTEKEIKHMREGLKELSMFSPRESNINDPGATGWDSIKYDTFSPLIVQERLLVESQLKENTDALNDFLGLSSNVNTFGNKYVVIQAYWRSKKKVGKVTFIDEQGEEQTALVDDTYKQTPNQVGKVEWQWINQWYKGYKIGPDIYNVQEFKLLDYCPILGVVYEIKNVSQAKSLVDLLKPYQIIFNVCLNQLYKLLEKEVGHVQIMSIRHIPVPKDGDAKDAIEIWEEEARKRGVVFIDDSPENLKSPSSFNQFRDLDLTRTAEIESRYQLATQVKMLAWELVGTNRERLGNVAATQTATGVQTATAQSYAQTEPYFEQHEYVLNEVYQAILDASQYIETRKPYSTISYVNTEGESAFIQVNAEDIKLKDLKVFVTSRKKDQQEFESLRNLSQAMLQNGATPYEVIQLYTTNSIRQMKQVFKNLKEKQEQMMQQQQELENLKVQQEQKQFDYQQQQEQVESANDRQFEHNEKELDRLSKEKIAYITAMGLGLKEDPTSDPNNLELQQLSTETETAQREYELKLRDMEKKQKESSDYIQMELEKIQVQREKIAADLAKEKIKAKAKPKTPPKK